MTKRIKAVSILIIFAIIISACCAIAVVNAKSIDTPTHFKEESISDSSITISWKAVKHAEGYHIYSLQDGDYKKIIDINAQDTNKYTFEDIKDVTKYTLKITAYRYFSKDEYESDMSQELFVYSKPHKPSASGKSPEEKTLEVTWSAQKNVDGYEVEYSKNEDFSDSTVVDLGSEDKSFKLNELTPDDVYYTRERSYIEIDGKKVYSDYSDTDKITIKDTVKMPDDIDPNKKMVALSFDDGPAYDNDGSNSTEKILKVLEKHGARATFFMVGDRVNDETAHLLKKEIELGCELGNHTISHKNYGSKVTKSDIKKGSDRIKKYCGQAPTFFRCPGGSITSTIKKECIAENMPLAYWSVDTEDWKSKDAKKIYKKAMEGVYDGAIILMHDIYPTTAEAVAKLVPALIEEGYQVVTVSELITAKTGKAPIAGEQYVDYKTINNNT